MEHHGQTRREAGQKQMFSLIEAYGQGYRAQ